MKSIGSSEPKVFKPSIPAVSARLRTGRLRVHFPNCLNLLEEAKAYRYPRMDERAEIGENPIDESTHALGGKLR